MASGNIQSSLVTLTGIDPDGFFFYYQEYLNLYFTAPEQYARCHNMDDLWLKAGRLLPMPSSSDIMVGKSGLQRKVLRHSGNVQS